jgi:antirestriction protein ArdC
METVEVFVGNTSARVSYSGMKACYRPSSDDILMPDRERFDSEVHPSADRKPRRQR